MRYLLPMLLVLIACTCVRAQASTGPSLTLSLGYNGIKYGKEYPNSLSYGTYAQEGIGGPVLGIGYRPDMSKGQLTGLVPAFEIGVSFSRLTKSSTDEEVGGLSIERNFGLTTAGAAAHAGFKTPLSSSAASPLYVEFGLALNVFLVFNEKRENVRYSNSGVNTFALNFKEKNNFAIGPFVGLQKSRGRYTYGLRGHFLGHFVSKRGALYPRSYTMPGVELNVGYRLKS